MALEDIFRALEEQADKDIADVLAEAKEHAKAIHDDAVREAETARETRVAQAEEATRQRTMQSLNSVRLEMRKQVASAKERAVASVFDEARDLLGAVRDRADYPALFTSFLKEAVDGVDGEFELLVDPADVDLGRAVLSELGAKATVSADIDTAGGAVVAVDRRRVLRRNTLEDRLDKFEGASQADVAEILFA